LFGDLGDLLDGEDVELRITDRLAVEQLGVWLKGLAESVGIIGIDKADLDAELREGVTKKIIRSAVQLRNGDHVVAAAADIEDRTGDGGLAAGVGKGAGTALQRRDTLFEDIGGRIHDPRVDVSEFLEAEEVRGVLGVAEQVAGGLVDRDGARESRRIWRLPGVDGPG